MDIDIQDAVEEEFGIVYAGFFLDFTLYGGEEGGIGGLDVSAGLEPAFYFVVQDHQQALVIRANDEGTGSEVARLEKGR